MTEAPGSDTGTELVDTAALARWMDAEGLPGDAVTDARALAGGTQNLLLRFSRGGRDYVLRRGPRHLRRASNEVMRREMRVLQALAGSDVPHPAYIAGPGEPTTGVAGDAVFYLMAPVDGLQPHGRAPRPARRRRRPSATEMGLRGGRRRSPRLGQSTTRPSVSSDFGKPDGFLERQVPRWMDELDVLRRARRLPGPEIPGLDEVAAWLDANRPHIVAARHHARRLPPRQPDVRARRAPASPPSSTGRCARSATRCSTSAGCSPRGRSARRPDRAPVRRRMASVVTGALGDAGGLPTPDELVARLRRALDARPVRHRVVHGAWPASSSASSSRAPTPGPAPARPRSRPATCSTPSRSGCSPGPAPSSRRLTHGHRLHPQPRARGDPPAGPRLHRRRGQARRGEDRRRREDRAQRRTSRILLRHARAGAEPPGSGCRTCRRSGAAWASATSSWRWCRPRRRSRDYGPWVLNCQAPDEGNMHTLLHWAHRRAEGEVPPPALRGPGDELLRHDRARGRRLRPDAHPDPRRTRTATSG